MKPTKLERFTLHTIADAVRCSADIEAVRLSLARVIGAAVETSGTVRKVVKRTGEEKIVIESADVPGFVVFAHCPGALETLTKSNIRKGAAVAVKGTLTAFGTGAVNLSACRVIGSKVDKTAHSKKGKLEQVGTRKKQEKARPDQRLKT